VSRLFATALLALALVGGLALPALPCVAPASPGAGLVRALAYGVGSLVCHQRPERSLSSCGRQWPVCGRCSGLYLGAAAGVLLAAAGVGRRGNWQAWRRRVLMSAIPTGALWFGEVVGLGDPGTPLRLALALLPGVVTALWLSAVSRGDLR
jgi:uncharacterized membrane protein